MNPNSTKTKTNKDLPTWKGSLTHLLNSDKSFPRIFKSNTKLVHDTLFTLVNVKRLVSLTILLFKCIGVFRLFSNYSKIGTSLSVLLWHPRSSHKESVIRPVVNLVVSFYCLSWNMYFLFVCFFWHLPWVKGTEGCAILILLRKV